MGLRSCNLRKSSCYEKEQMLYEYLNTLKCAPSYCMTTTLKEQIRLWKLGNQNKYVMQDGYVAQPLGPTGHGYGQTLLWCQKSRSQQLYNDALVRHLGDPFEKLTCPRASPVISIRIQRTRESTGGQVFQKFLTNHRKLIALTGFIGIKS